MKKQITTALLLAALPAAGFSQTVITTADGDGADANVRRGEDTANYGGDPNILVRDAASTSDRKAYFRFDLTGAPSGTIESASLDLVFTGLNDTSTSREFRFFGLNDGYTGGGGELGEDWLEGDGTGQESGDPAGPGEISWSNAPGNNTGSSFGFDSGATTLLGTLNVDLSTYSVGDTFSVTDSDLGGLLSFIEADTDNSLTMMASMSAGNSSSGITWASKENETHDAPTLNITAVPEPAAVALLMGCLAGGLILLRRRR